MGSGLVGLHVKAVLAGKSFIISRNCSGRGSLPMASEAPGHQPNRENMKICLIQDLSFSVFWDLKHIKILKTLGLASLSVSLNRAKGCLYFYALLTIQRCCLSFADPDQAFFLTTDCFAALPLITFFFNRKKA